MKHDTRKLLLNKQTLRTFGTTELHEARGAGYYVDSVITCDVYCWHWSYFTR